MLRRADVSLWGRRRHALRLRAHRLRALRLRALRLRALRRSRLTQLVLVLVLGALRRHIVLEDQVQAKKHIIAHQLHIGAQIVAGVLS